MRKIANVTTLLLLLVLSFILGATSSLAQTDAPSDIVCEYDIIVQPDETLFQISINNYGDYRGYRDIIEATNLKAQTDESYATITNENRIKAGSKLCIPSETSVTRPTPTPISTSTPVSTSLDGVIKIGAAQALSGPNDAYGNSIIEGLELAVSQINDSDYLAEATLEVVREDTKGIPLEAIRAFNKLINEDEVVAIIGPTFSDSALVADWLAQQEGVPVVSSSNTAPAVTDIGSYIFSTALPDSTIIPNTIREAKNQFGLERVAVIYDDKEEITRSSYESFTEALAVEGLTLVATETFTTTKSVFSERLTRIRDQNPDAIVVSALPAEADEMVKQARELGIPESIRLLAASSNSPELFKSAGEAANGAISGVAWHADSGLSNNKQFVADFKEAHNREPDQFAAQAYTAVWALATAIRNANSIDRATIRDALDEMPIIESPLGPFTFDDNRDAVHASVIQVVDNGEFSLQTMTPIPPNPDKIIKIGAAHILSGDRAPYNLGTRNAINLAVKEINESGFLGEVALELAWEDTKKIQPQAVQAFYKLINDDQVVAILGPSHSNSAFAALLLAQEAGVPVIASSLTATDIVDIGDYIFRTSLPDSAFVFNTVKVSKELLGLQRVAVMYDEVDPATRSGYEILLKVLEHEGLKVESIETFRTGDTDFSQQFTKIKKLNPDAIVLSALQLETPLILRQARELGIPPTVRFLGPLPTSTVLTQAGEAADGVIFASAWNIESDDRDSKKFVAAYRAEYGTDPDLLAAQAYTAVRALAEAMRKANDPTDRTAVRNALDNLGVIRSPLGLFRFDEKGDPVHDQVVQVVVGGKFVSLEKFIAELPSQSPSDLPSVIKVGAAHALSGPADPYGNPSYNGINLAVKQINESEYLGTAQLEVIWEDTAGDKHQAREVFEKLINEDEVVAILGPTLSNSAFEADPLAQEAGVPVIANSNTATGITQIGDYIFRTSLPESVVIPNTIKQIKASRGVEKVAVIYDEADQFTKSSYEVFEQVLQEEGIEIVITERFNTDDTDFSAQLTRIKELNPEAIVVSAFASQAAEILKQARQLGIPERVYFIGGNGFNTPQLFELAGEAANGAISGAAWNIQSSHLASQDFVEAYQAEYGTDPDQFAAQAYTAVLVLAEALRDANSVEGAAIRDALAGLDENNKIDSPLGSFYFDENRDPVHMSVVQEMQNGEFIIK